MGGERERESRGILSCMSHDFNRLVLKEFCVQLLECGYNYLMRVVRVRTESRDIHVTCLSFLLLPGQHQEAAFNGE